MSKSVLYLGDTGLREAASYLAGVMTHYQIGFDYVSSSEKFDSGWLSRDYRAIVLSDYPAGNFTGDQLQILAQKVQNGLGLLMIGGWESFSGLGGGYTHTPLKEVLPVVMQDGDDRVNSSSPCLIEKNMDHPILEGLPFEEEVTGVGGYNIFRAKEDSRTLLSLRPFQVRRTGGQYHFTEKET
ncbi:MAG TPA: glutamine amidotransferase, partial [Anaerohalosphaeraceae bacterium]|nr:glutamine amidotransferase [Anaerohalosphaeraceae bacterium]